MYRNWLHGGPQVSSRPLCPTLATAQTYEVWEGAACELDDVLGKDFWYLAPNGAMKLLLTVHTGVKIPSVDTMTTG
jgi:hypothetical protein